MLLVPVKLTDVGQKVFVRIIIIWKKIDIPLNQFPLTNKENLHTHPSLVHVVTKDIPILQIMSHNPLLGSQS